MRVRATLWTTLTAVIVLGAGMLSACGSSNGSSPDDKDGGPGGEVVKDRRPDDLASSLSVEPGEAAADGAATVKITVTLKTKSLEPVPDFPVTIESSGTGNKLGPVSGNTDALGVFTSTLASTTAERKTVKATFGDIVLNASATFSACRGPLFRVAPKSPIVPLPMGAATGDFNGDQKLDIAVIDRDDVVGIALGNGDGTFSKPTPYAVGDYPYSVASADFNKDGKADLAVANANSNNISVLLGNGDGTFMAATYNGVPYSPGFVTTGDVDRDGKLDIVAVEENGGVSVLLGNGNGTFLAAKNYGAGTRPMSAGIADFNHDNIPDLLVTSAAANDKGLCLLLGKGDGTFGTCTEYDTVGSALVSIGDFTGDTVPDAVTAGGEVLSLVRGNGDGTLTKLNSYKVLVQYASSVAAANLNGDAKLDAVAVSTYENNVLVMLGNGDGTLSPPLKFPTDPGPKFVAPGDFDGDGKLDLVVNNGQSTQILLNTGCIP